MRVLCLFGAAALMLVGFGGLALLLVFGGLQ